MYNTRHKNNNENSILLYGKHACLAALSNPKRKCRRLFITKNSLNELPKNIKTPATEIIETKDIVKKFPHLDDAVHQGVILEVSPLPDYELASVTDKSPLVILDQVTDPHNVGAILRSAAAFNAGAIIVTKQNSPAETAILAKSASGALEIVPIIKVTNLARAMDELKKNGYWCVGMDGSAPKTIRESKLPDKIALVMGAEGRGLRQLTQKSCDMLIKLPISDKVESLNVSNAAAIALYELSVKC